MILHLRCIIHPPPSPLPLLCIDKAIHRPMTWPRASISPWNPVVSISWFDPVLQQVGCGFHSSCIKSVFYMHGTIKKKRKKETNVSEERNQTRMLEKSRCLNKITPGYFVSFNVRTVLTDPLSQWISAQCEDACSGQTVSPLHPPIGCRMLSVSPVSLIFQSYWSWRRFTMDRERELHL